MEPDFPFDEPTNLAVISTRQVIREGRPVLLVSHDRDDGGWQFLHAERPKIQDAMIVALENLVRRDPTLSELADLPLGWNAWRSSIDDPWIREPDPADC